MTKKRLFIASIVGVFLIVLSMFLLAHKEVQAPVISDNGLGLSVVDQKVGLVVHIQKVRLKTPGFVVIHKSINDFPVDVVGFSAYLDAGTYENIDIPLQSEVVAGTKLFGLIHEDNGDRIFTPSQDFSALKEDKKVFMVPFVSR